MGSAATTLTRKPARVLAPILLWVVASLGSCGSEREPDNDRYAALESGSVANASRPASTDEDGDRPRGNLQLDAGMANFDAGGERAASPPSSDPAMPSSHNGGPPRADVPDAGPSRPTATDAGTIPDADRAEPAPRLLPVEPRFLVATRGPHYMQLMDRHGEVVRDFGPLVELGDRYQAVRLSADGRVLELVEPSIGGGPVWFSDRPGAEPHYWKGLKTSRPLVLRAGHKTMDATRFRVLSIQGEMLADFEVPGTWDEPEISPQSGYLAARGELVLGAPLWAVVLDIMQGTIVWRGIVSRPLFSHDDRYFLYNVPNVGPIVGHNVLVDLPSGRERRLNPPPSMSNHPAVPTPEPLVMYYTTDAGMFGTAGFPTAAWIWFVPWGGQHVPFDPSLPNTARDRLGGVSEDGLVHWSRGSDDRDMPIASEGAYAFDPATGESQRRDTQCYVPAGQTRWTMRDNSLLACELGQPYREVLELPQLDEQWRYSVRGRSEEGDRVLIEIRWGGSELKYDYPGMATFVYDNSGRLLLEAPFGYATLDKTGTLLVHNTPRTREVNLIDVDSGTLTPLGPGTLGQILYEPASP